MWPRFPSPPPPLPSPGLHHLLLGLLQFPAGPHHPPPQQTSSSHETAFHLAETQFYKRVKPEPPRLLQACHLQATPWHRSPASCRLSNQPLLNLFMYLSVYAPPCFTHGMKPAADQDSFCQEDARVSEPSAKDATPGSPPFAPGP